MSINHKKAVVVLSGVIALVVGTSSAFAGEGRVTAVANGGGEITIDSGGEAITSKISAQTTVTINGVNAKPEDVQVGMNCVTDVVTNGDVATAFDCLTEKN